jgi:hypothetical protein
MTYKGLQNLFEKVSRSIKIPQVMLYDYEILIGGYGNHVFLVGKSEAGNVITISCQFFGDAVVKDSDVLQSYNRMADDWEKEYFDAGYRSGIERDVLESTLFRVLMR